MLNDHQVPPSHEWFKEIAALAGSGTVTPREWSQFKAHLDVCQECRQALRQYQMLATAGITALAAAYAERPDSRSWNSAATRDKLMARVRAQSRNTFERTEPPPVSANVFSFGRVALAACLIVAIGAGAYRLGRRGSSEAVSPTRRSSDDRLQSLAAEKQAQEQLLVAQSAKLAQTQQETTQREQELAQLRSSLRTLEGRSTQLAAASNQSAGQLQATLHQRDALNEQLRQTSQTYQNLLDELAGLKADREEARKRVSALEAKLEELSATNLGQERRLKDAEQFLASDRDIRELMGARKLYIADVFDVDGSSRTRKPFGRVFYTQGKSLIFYAFDLDGKPGIVNANSYQVWGQKEIPFGDQPSPQNLGILYMDNESNRRWMMRFDDPKRLAQIDAVFVTVEPHGGSPKPTGKPFLYALLRNEVNHP